MDTAIIALATFIQVVEDVCRFSKYRNLRRYLDGFR